LAGVERDVTVAGGDAPASCRHGSAPSAANATRLAASATNALVRNLTGVGNAGANLVWRMLELHPQRLSWTSGMY